MESAEFQLRRDLPDDAAARFSATYAFPAVLRSAVEIAVRVKYHAAGRSAAVAAAGKVVQQGVRPTAIGGCQFENRARSIGARVRRAVEITGRVHNETVTASCRSSPRSGKAVKQGKCPATV